MSGEGMVALWGGLKSVLKPGDLVVSLDNGIYGEGIGQMAAQCGAEVHYVKRGVSEAFSAEEVTSTIRRLRPKLVTAVHCDTPSG